MALRPIEEFGTDDDGVWVAQLSCGHAQHVRHEPPWQLRPWVETEAGRAGMIGSELDCLFWDMPALPEDAVVYKTTVEFDEATIPKGLTHQHRTKAGTWGRIVVLEGKLRYQVDGPPRQSWVLGPGVAGIDAPQAVHSVTPVGAVRFRVEFLRSG